MAADERCARRRPNHGSERRSRLAKFISLGNTLGMPLVSWRPEGVSPKGMDPTGCDGASIASCTTENTEVTEKSILVFSVTSVFSVVTAVPERPHAPSAPVCVRSSRQPAQAGNPTGHLDRSPCVGGQEYF